MTAVEHHGAHQQHASDKGRHIELWLFWLGTLRHWNNEGHTL